MIRRDMSFNTSRRHAVAAVAALCAHVTQKYGVFDFFRPFMTAQMPITKAIRQIDKIFLLDPNAPLGL